MHISKRTRRLEELWRHRCERAGSWKQVPQLSIRRERGRKAREKEKRKNWINYNNKNANDRFTDRSQRFNSLWKFERLLGQLYRYEIRIFFEAPFIFSNVTHPVLGKSKPYLHILYISIYPKPSSVYSIFWKIFPTGYMYDRV